VLFERFAIAAALVAWANGAHAQAGAPPSPYGDDKGGVYDHASGCWVWDHGSTGKFSAPGYQFVTDSTCDGRPLEGKAIIHWSKGRRGGETWDGNFSYGKFTGRATAHDIHGDAESTYVDGMRNGPARLIAPGGARWEMNLKNDLLDGPSAKIFSDGSRDDFVYERGKQVGPSLITFRDGSKVEVPPEEYFGQNPGVFITASGEQLKGNYQRPHVDMAKRPAFVLPERSIGKTGIVGVSVSLTVAEDGSVHDPRLARSSGILEVDQAVLRQISIWHFFPATLDGKPMTSMTIFEMDVNLG
jgi:TonB family protein